MDLVSAASALAALGHPTRLAALALLAKHNKQGLPVGEVAAELKVSVALISSHLQILEQASLVTRERHGKSVRCRADHRSAESLLAYLHKVLAQTET